MYYSNDIVNWKVVLSFAKECYHLCDETNTWHKLVASCSDSSADNYLGGESERLELCHILSSLSNDYNREGTDKRFQYSSTHHHQWKNIGIVFSMMASVIGKNKFYREIYLRDDNINQSQVLHVRKEIPKIEDVPMDPKEPINAELFWQKWSERTKKPLKGDWLTYSFADHLDKTCSQWQSPSNTFRKYWLTKLLSFKGVVTDDGEWSLDKVAKLYNIGFNEYADKEGRNLHNLHYFVTDHQGNIWNWKSIPYDQNGKRIKNPDGSGILNQRSANKKHVFGEHLITDGCRIGIVESEKSAILCASLYSEFVWLASGGKEQLRSVLDVARGHQIIIFADADAKDKWQDLANSMGCNIQIPSTFMGIPLEGKSDVADIIEYVSDLIDDETHIREIVRSNGKEILALFKDFQLEISAN